MDVATNVASSPIVSALAVTGPRPRAIRMYKPIAGLDEPGSSRARRMAPSSRWTPRVRGGAPTTLAVGLFRGDGYAVTAIAAEAMAEQLLDGSAWRPGLHRIGLIVDSQRLFADVQAMGARVETDDPVLARRPSA